MQAVAECLEEMLEVGGSGRQAGQKQAQLEILICGGFCRGLVPSWVFG